MICGVDGIYDSMGYQANWDTIISFAVLIFKSMGLSDGIDYAADMTIQSYEYQFPAFQFSG